MDIFISTSTFAQYDPTLFARLKKKKISFALNPFKRKLTEQEILGILSSKSYDGLIAGVEPLTTRVLEAAKSLRVISRVGVGMDNINLDAAKKLGIKVYNTPNVLGDSVAELTIGLILASLRKIPLADRNVRQQRWKKEMGALFKGKVLGIIGFGAIGRKVAELASVFGAKIIYADIKKSKQRKFRQVSLEKLLKEADIISLHCSTKEQIIGQKEIGLMKKDVILVNAARGTLIDEQSLYDGLATKKIGAAALDVFAQEPYTGQLTKLENVIVTPHIGSYAKEARIKMEIQAVENLIKGLKGARKKSAV